MASGMRRSHDTYFGSSRGDAAQDVDAVLESRIGNLERLLEENDMSTLGASRDGSGSARQGRRDGQTSLGGDRRRLEANIDELEGVLFQREANAPSASVPRLSEEFLPQGNPRSPALTEMSSAGISSVGGAYAKQGRGDIAPKSARKARVSTSWRQLNAMLERAGFSAVALDDYGAPKLNFDYTDADGDELEPGTGSLIRAFQDLLTQFEERGRALDAANTDQGRHRDKDEKSEERLAAVTRELFAVRLKLKAAENRVIELNEDNSRIRKGDATALERLRKDNASLQQKVTLSEHRVKAKEAVLERLQAKLETQAKRSDASAEKGRDTFKSLAGGRAPRSANPKDQKLLEAVTGLEAEKEQIIEERELLQAEVRRLNEALRARDNALSGSSGANLEQLQSQLLSKADAAEKDQQVAAAALEEREKSVLTKLVRLERQLAVIGQEKQRVEDHCDNLALELASRPTMRDWKAAQRRIAKLEQQVQTAVEALEEQAADEYRQQGIFVPLEQRKRISTARPKRSRAKRSSDPDLDVDPRDQQDDDAASVDIVDKENGAALLYNAKAFSNQARRDKDRLTPREKVELMASRAVAEEQDNRHRRDTLDMIRRDKLNHRLGLNKITALPRSSAHELIQQLCRILELSDPELLVPALQKMCWIVRAMPRLEQFTKQVVGFVAIHGDQVAQKQQGEARFLAGARESENAGHLPPDAAIAAVMPQLKRWSVDIKRLNLADTFQNQVRTEINRSAALHVRAQGADAALLSSDSKRPQLDAFEMTEAQVIGCLRELVEVERTLLDSHEAYQSAEQHIKDHPDVLSSRFVTHFRELFGVKTIKGVFPKLNEVFVFSNEMKHFLQVARPTLGLGPRATSHACLSKLQNVAIEADKARSVAPQSADFGLTATDDVQRSPRQTDEIEASKSTVRFKVPTWN